MIALLLGTIPICLFLYLGARLVDREADRRHEIRWHDRFYQPQLPVRRGRVIDVRSEPVRSIDR